MRKRADLVFDADEVGWTRALKKRGEVEEEKRGGGGWKGACVDSV